MPPFIDFRFWIEIIDSLNSTAGLLLNLLLIYLIAKKTSKKMYEYRPILIQNCLVDFLYTVIEFLVKPVIDKFSINLHKLSKYTLQQIDFKNGYFYLMCSGFFANISTPWNNVLVNLWVFSLFLCLTSVSVQFIYRYFIIVRNQKLSILQYSGILTIPTILALIYAVSHFTVFSYEKESYEIAVKQIAEDSFYELSGIPNFIVADIRTTELKLELAFAYLLVTVSYMVIFYTSFKVYKQLLQMKTLMSQQNFRFQRQITLTLFAQAIVPSVCCIVPIGISVTMVVVKTNIPGAGAILSLILSAIPIANPLTTIIIISRYRKSCFSFFKTFLLSNRVISISHISSDIITHNQHRIHP